MGTLILAGKLEWIQGVYTRTWLDDPTLRLVSGQDYVARETGQWIHVVMLHSSRGMPWSSADDPQRVIPGRAPLGCDGQRASRFWSRPGAMSGAHLVVDQDGTVCQGADLVAEKTCGCDGWNAGAVHVELVQGSGGELYAGQLECMVTLVDWLTRRFGITRCIPHRYTGPVRRFLDYGDKDFVGIVGHRECSRARGIGDPGSRAFYALGSAGYEPRDYSLSEERDHMRRVQREHGITPPDGVARASTVERLRAVGYPAGLEVVRPGD